MKNILLISGILCGMICFQIGRLWEINEFKQEQTRLKIRLGDLSAKQEDLSAELENIETQLHIDRESVQD